MRSEDSDHVAHNIPQHRDVLLNELPKQIFMLLPLLLLLLLLLYVLYHVHRRTLNSLFARILNRMFVYLFWGWRFF